MSVRRIHRSALAVGITFALAMATTQPAAAATDTKDLKAMQQQVELLKQQLHTMELKVDAAVQDAAKANQKVKEVQSSVSQANASAQNATATALNAIVAPESADLKFRFAGSVTADYGFSNRSDPQSSFGGGTFLPIFLARYKDLAELEAHMEVVNDGAATSTSLEYAQIDLFLNDYATLVTGKFLSPIGQFQQSLHPGWINKLPDRPAGFVEGGGGEALSEVGVQMRGAFPLGNMTADYAVYVGNGPQLQPDGLSLSGYSQDNNNNKSFGGRLGLHPIPDVDLGISAMHSRVPSNATNIIPGSTGSSASHNLYDVDFSYTPPNIDIRGEYVHAKLQPVLFDDQSGAPAELTRSATWKLWYLQGAYRLSGITSDPTLGKFEIVARRSQSTISGGILDWGLANEKRSEIGLNYWWAPTLVSKIAYEHKTFQSLPNDNVLRLQMAFGF
ncbi:MAG: hypothetical protein EPN69_10225 [Rhodanobacter sp.]|nr:MAG: hypothetical protein EPN69_10225 [Rhodanobacter sp.]TAM42161.1 MAG: hypothetical protein EPN58_04000 [Rhodanobacter sp.]TAN26762.1 MAG: hypothetical protein EPN32_05870 [Rhodanobacter sp.]